MINTEIPKNIKDLITKDFLKEFKKQLFSMWCWWSRNEEDFTEYSEKDFADFCFNEIGTGYWDIAFENACKTQKTEELLIYKNSLDWQEIDIFDSEIAKKLIGFREEKNK